MKAVLSAVARALRRAPEAPRRAGAAVLLAALAAAAPLHAQGVFLDRGQSGKGAEARLTMEGGTFRSAGVLAGYSLEGFLDLGMDLQVASSTAASGDALEMRAAIAVALPVLKQDAQVPLSLVLRGGFSKAAFLGSALDASSLVKQGTGFSAGVDLLHAVSLGPQWAVRAGASAAYSSFTYVTAAEDGAVAGYPAVETEGNLLFGVLAGMTFQPSKGFLVAFTVRVSMDPSLSSVWWEPSLTVVAPDL